MKTVLLTIASRSFEQIAKTSNYYSAKSLAEGLNCIVDNQRDLNGKRPVLSLEAWDFNDNKLSIRFFFEFDSSDEAVESVMTTTDFQKWLVYNGRTVWYQQKVDLLAWNETYNEEVNEGAIIEYLNDILTGRVAYKQAEFTICNYEVGETFDKIGDRNND